MGLKRREGRTKRGERGGGAVVGPLPLYRPLTTAVALPDQPPRSRNKIHAVVGLHRRAMSSLQRVIMGARVLRVIIAAACHHRPCVACAGHLPHHHHHQPEQHGPGGERGGGGTGGDGRERVHCEQRFFLVSACSLVVVLLAKHSYSCLQAPVTPCIMSSGYSKR